MWNKEKAEWTEPGVKARLKSLPQEPIPPGLRERVLDAAQRRREVSRWTTPGLRAALAVSAALFALCFMIDGRISRREAGRLEALLNGPRASPSMAARNSGEAAEGLREILGPGGSEFEKWLLARLDYSQRVQARAASRELAKENRYESEFAQDIF